MAHKEQDAVKILLAIDQSENSRAAVQFAAKMLAPHQSKHTVTLYHVIETLPEYLLLRGGEANAEAYHHVIDDLTATRRTEGERLLAEQKQAVQAAGVPAVAVTTKLEVRDALPEAKKVVAALAIIDEMKSGEYDLVCLGRRGGTAAEGTFLGSVAEKVLREAGGRTVWVIDG